MEQDSINFIAVMEQNDVICQDMDVSDVETGMVMTSTLIMRMCKETNLNLDELFAEIKALIPYISDGIEVE